MRIVRATAALAAAVSCFSVAGAAVETRVIRVGVESEAIGPWHVDANPSLAAAIRAFGSPSSCETVKGLPGFASVEWRQLGLLGVFGSYGIPGGRACQLRRAVVLDNARASGQAWRTGKGLRVGDSVAKLHRLYPNASLRGYRRDIPPIRGWWLVVRTGFVPERFQFPALLATARGGRVTGLVVTVGAEGD